MWETCIYRNKFIVEWRLGEPDSKINSTIWNNFYKALLNDVQNWKFIKVILKIPVGIDKFDENGNINYRYVEWRLINTCNYKYWYCIRTKSCRGTQYRSKL